MNSQHFVDKSLLERLANEIESEPTHLAASIIDKPFDKLIFIFSLANFRPKNWETTFVPALKENVSHPELNQYFNTVLRLISLDYYDDKMIKRMFDEQFWNEIPTDFDITTRNLVSFFKIYQSVAINAQINQNDEFLISPAVRMRLAEASKAYLNTQRKTNLDTFIPTIFDKKYFLSSVSTSYNHFIEFVFKFNTKSNELAIFSADYSNDELILLEDIQCDPDEVL